MCGIVLIYGEKAVSEIPVALTRIAHRGPDDQHFWFKDQLAIGFVRLAINDESLSGRQPYESGEMIAAFNGEVFNALQLASQYNILLDSECDTHIIAPLFAQIGDQILTELDGFYSGLIYQSETSTLHLFRDYMGKKPLFYGDSESGFFVASELKAIQAIKWFKKVPLGVSKLDLKTGQLLKYSPHEPKKIVSSDLLSAMENAVKKRLPTQSFGIFLSGGLDSSIIAAIACKYRDDITFFTLGIDESPDAAMVERMVRHLGIQKIYKIPLPAVQQLPGLIEEVVYSTESYNPSTISNGVATYLLAQAARAEGLKVVLTGEGADEVFSGYHQDLSEVEWEVTRKNLIQDMNFTELRRLDKCCMAHGIEARCPFLDQQVTSIAENLDYEHFYRSGSNKVILRETFRNLLPEEVADRRKTSFDVGSGVRGLVVNYLTRNHRTETEELKHIWKDRFGHDANDPYFFSYPTFDAAIAKRGETHR